MLRHNDSPAPPPSKTRHHHQERTSIPIHHSCIYDPLTNSSGTFNFEAPPTVSYMNFDMSWLPPALRCSDVATTTTPTPHAVARKVPSFPYTTAYTPSDFSLKQSLHLKRIKKMGAMRQQWDRFLHEADKEKYSDFPGENSSKMLNKMKNGMEEMEQWSNQAICEGRDEEGAASEDNTSEEAYQVFIKILSGKSISLNVKGGETIGRLKKKMGPKLGGMPVDCLVYEGKLLNDNQSLLDYGIHRNTIVQSRYRLLGGMKNCFACFKTSEPKTIEDKSKTESTSGNASPPITQQELEDAIKNSDSSKSVTDRYCPVYVAYLRNQLMAIKKVNLGIGTDAKEIYDDAKNEPRVLERCEHSNILNLRYFHEVKTKDTCYLASDYMENGSVYQHLHGDKAAQKQMTWIRRLDILVGVLNAVHYLHNDHNPPIYHGDLKTANIFLDENFCPKLADFGMSRFATDTARPTGGGTPGYKCPYDQALGAESDIFALGIIIFELLTGKKPIDAATEVERAELKGKEPEEDLQVKIQKLLCEDDSVAKSEINALTKMFPSSGADKQKSRGFCKWIDLRIQREDPILDENLEGQYVDPGALKRLLDLARLCTAPDRHRRPQAKEVRDVLTDTRNLVLEQMQN